MRRYHLRQPVLAILATLLAVCAPALAIPRVAATVPVGLNPAGVAVNPFTNRIYVTNFGSRDLYVLDGTTHQVLATIPVGPGPFGVAVNRLTNRVYVGNSQSNTVSVIDGSLNQGLTTIQVRWGPWSLAVNEVTNRIYVGNHSGSVSVVDGNTNAVLKTIPLAFSMYGGPHGVTIDPVNNLVYVGIFYNGVLSVIDGVTDSETHRIGAGGWTYETVLNPLTNYLYTSHNGFTMNYNSNVSVINASTGALVGDINVGGQAGGIALDPASDTIYVARYYQGDVAVIDCTTNTMLGTVPVGLNPIGVAVNPVTGRVYVSNWGDHTVSVLADDDTHPITQASVAGASGANGWYRGAVTVTLAAEDTGSGVASTWYALDGADTQAYAGPFLVAGEGAHVVSFWSVDRAGNIEAAHQLALGIDGTAPHATAKVNRSTLWPPNGKSVDVVVSGAIADGLSGVAGAAFTVTDEYGAVQPSGTIRVAADGSYDLTVALQASRRGSDKDGRQYTITIGCSDVAGNTAEATVGVTVPHDQR